MRWFLLLPKAMLYVQKTFLVHSSNCFAALHFLAVPCCMFKFISLEWFLLHWLWFCCDVVVEIEDAVRSVCLKSIVDYVPVKTFNMVALKLGDFACKIILAPSILAPLKPPRNGAI